MKGDLTRGSAAKCLLYFSLPYLLSYFLQTLYGMADLFIIGQYEAVASSTAVAIGSQVMHMLTVMIVGLAMGSTVMIGRAVGAKDEPKARKNAGNTLSLFLIISVVITVVLVLFVKPIVSVMDTPSEAASATEEYLIVCFIGIPFITAYNVISSVFRGGGDSKSPMYFIAVSCFFNILLDYLFIGAFHLGAVGAALGTTLSQAISAAVSVMFAKKKHSDILPERGDFKFKKDTIFPILKIGVPVALQDGLIQVAFLVITIIANNRGLTDSGAVGIVEKIISFLFLVPSSLLSSVSALGAINIGAGKPERAKKTLKLAIFAAISFGALISAVMQFAAPVAVGAFNHEQPVVAAGAEYLKGYILDCALAGVHFCMSGYFCAIGKSWISFMHNIISVACVRVPGAYLMSKMFPNTLFPMGLATAAGSLVSAIICVIAYIVVNARERRKLQVEN